MLLLHFAEFGIVYEVWSYIWAGTQLVTTSLSVLLEVKPNVSILAIEHVTRGEDDPESMFQLITQVKCKKFTLRIPSELWLHGGCMAPFTCHKDTIQ